LRDVSDAQMQRPPTGQHSRALPQWLPALKAGEEPDMIRKLKSGEYRLYARKADPRTGRRRNLGTFATRAAAQKHERAVQYFKRHR
jgi:CRP-like cAMP-binding protein